LQKIVSVTKLIPVLEKITSTEGKAKLVSWRGHILNLPGYSIYETTREKLDSRLAEKLAQLNNRGKKDE
jgi:hypothetical protein